MSGSKDCTIPTQSSSSSATTIATNAIPLSATFVDNEGNETPNLTPVKWGVVYVVGKKTDWWKMASMDKTGKLVEARYANKNLQFTEATWNSATGG